MTQAFTEHVVAVYKKAVMGRIQHGHCGVRVGNKLNYSESVE